MNLKHLLRLLPASSPHQVSYLTSISCRLEGPGGTGLANRLNSPPASGRRIGFL